jgi:hypothetical protein
MMPMIPMIPMIPLIRVSVTGHRVSRTGDP